MLMRSKFIFIDNFLDLKTTNHCYKKKKPKKTKLQWRAQAFESNNQV